MIRRDPKRGRVLVFEIALLDIVSGLTAGLAAALLLGAIVMSSLLAVGWGMLAAYGAGAGVTVFATLLTLRRAPGECQARDRLESDRKGAEMDEKNEQEVTGVTIPDGPLGGTVRALIAAVQRLGEENLKLDEENQALRRVVEGVHVTVEDEDGNVTQIDAVLEEAVDDEGEETAAAAPAPLEVEW